MMAGDGESPPERAPNFFNGRGTTAALGHPFLELLPIDGVSISIFDRLGQPVTLYASDHIAAQVDELQFDLGEGPVFWAFKTGLPVLIPDLADLEYDDWPFFRVAAADTEARSLVILPLMIGAVCVGVATLYRRMAGKLDDEEFERAMSVARSVSGPGLRAAASLLKEEPFESSAGSVVMRRDVHQATGMILVQLNINATDAFARLRAHAFSEGRTVHDVAADIINHTLDLSQLP